MTDDREADRRELVLKATGAAHITRRESIQSLWSGYGELIRYHVDGTRMNSVVLKDVDLTGGNRHPRGTCPDPGHIRKLRSYQVEANWYLRYGRLCDNSCRVPECFAATGSESRLCLVLEDLDASGFPVRIRRAGIQAARLGLEWLASFHARFLGTSPDQLWPVGTYWHLETRIEEWLRLTDEELKDAAPEIDRQLRLARYQTLVHGDAKLENFCFTPDLSSISAVDFQYAGQGIGMKDVAYFIGSVFDEDDSERLEEQLLSIYFRALRMHLPASVPADELENEWRDLYPLVWTDFHRFLLGWIPGPGSTERYSETMKQITLARLPIAQP